MIEEAQDMESEIKRPHTAYLFDIDGVLTNPSNVPMMKEETLDELHKRMQLGVIGFNTGQSLDFVVKQILEPLETRVQDRRELHHVVAIGEKGAAWITYDQEGNRIEHIDDSVRLPRGFQDEVRELSQKPPFSDVMFYDEMKQTMVTVQIQWGLPIDEYKKHQGAFVESAQELLKQHNLDQEFIVDPTRSAVDIESKHVGKAVGTRRFVELLAERGVKPEEFICFGDSISDYDMYKELKRLEKEVKLVFVGGREHFGDKDSTDVIFTEGHLDEGTFEYLQKEE